ncbi:MAG: chromosome segregation protein SMC [Pseudomonadota bacterium]
MKIKKLEITGFKSFHDKTAIKFPEGISAVVGPNGCGKSNIVDALRWVMGEQSVKQLRGKAMEDVIFAGASGKPPLNMAEVSLTLSNEDGSGPEEFKDYTEIMLTRRQYRSGERAYFINRQPCRLKDIYNVFMGSGMGAKSYAIIQQGNIGAIIDAGPLERRYFIEDAAGVTRYKSRKIEALRKMESTNRNLLRLADITTEISRQMSSLQRQARKAELFSQYQSRIRTLDVLLSLHRYAELNAKWDDMDRLLTQLRDTDIAHTTELKRIDAAVERVKLMRERKNQELSTKKAHHHESQRTIDRMETDLSHFRTEIDRLTGEISQLTAAQTDLKAKDAKIITEIEQLRAQESVHTSQIDALSEQIRQERNAAHDLTRRHERLTAELEQAKTTLMDLVAHEARLKNISQTAVRNREHLERRLKQVDEAALAATQALEGLHRQRQHAETELAGIKKDIDVRNQEIKQMQENLHQANQGLAAKIKEVHTLDIERSKARSQYAAMKKMEANFEWYRDGVKAILKAGQEKSAPSGQGLDASAAADVIGLLADVIEAENGYETAVEAALGDGLQYILVGRRQSASQAIDYLRHVAGGRSGFIPLDTVSAPEGTLPAISEGTPRLMDHVRIREGYQRVVAMLLGHVLISDDLAAAVTVKEKAPAATAVVTRQGDLITAAGVVIGGSAEKLSGILAKKKELKSLDAFVRSADAQMTAAKAAQQEMEAVVRRMETELQMSIERRSHRIQDELDAEKALYKIGEEIKHATRHLEVTRLEQEQLTGEAEDIDHEMSSAEKEVARITAAIEAAHQKVTQHAADITTVSSELASFNQKTVELKLAVASATAGLENNRQTLRRLSDFQKDGLDRLQQLEEDISRKAIKASEARNKVVQYEKTLQELYGSLREMETALARDEADYTEIDLELQQSDKKAADIQGRREDTLQKIRLLELERSQLDMKRENIGTRLVEQYHKPMHALKAELDEDPAALEAASQMTAADMASALEETRKKISTITDVNLGAIKEYEQLKDRFDFLTEQREDLEKALGDLQRVIKKINRITQERFMKTFDAVNEKIQEVFPRLFTGGTAKLVLTDSEDPLESGVEYLIQPPGKKLTLMSLLSGGEKALSAIAFIFSLFLLRPTAFCLMDEIDAPLDEANVTRFNELLTIIGEKSQIVMITHNKRSMEFADTLFGVTMEKKGISKMVSVNFDRNGTAADEPPHRSEDSRAA